MSGRAWFLGLALTAILPALPPHDAVAGDWAEMGIYLYGPHFTGELPPCDQGSVLDKIASRFNETQSVYWHSPRLTIRGYDQIRETAFRPWASNAIPRRFCSAMAYISDGSKRPVHYSIGEDTGMIGMTWGVEWCVVGLDRNWAYNPACRMAQP
jgi:hypothetical protein